MRLEGDFATAVSAHPVQLNSFQFLKYQMVKFSKASGAPQLATAIQQQNQLPLVKSGPPQLAQ